MVDSESDINLLQMNVEHEHGGVLEQDLVWVV